MSMAQSNLTPDAYAFDMVVATTGASINSTMKAFLNNMKGQKYDYCQVWDESFQKVPGDYSKIEQAAGKDLFSISSTTFTVQGGSIDGLTDDQKAIVNANNASFIFAFEATFGLPDFPLDKIPDTIVMDQGRGTSKVTYNIVFAEFKIVQLETTSRGPATHYIWTNLQQNSNDYPTPWTFRTKVNLDFSDAPSSDFDKLPDEVKIKLKNLNPNSAFSIQQLFLDLNTAGLDSFPQIQGLDTSSSAYTAIQTTFLDTYFKRLQESTGDVILGYAIKPVNPATQTPSFIPTDLNFVTSPYLSNGQPSDDYSLYTLNYLVMSLNHSLPETTGFPWNWVEASNKNNFSGVMAIRRETFATYLSQVMTPSLQKLAAVFYVDCHIEEVVELSYSWGFNFTGTIDPYAYNSAPGAQVLSTSYSKSNADTGGTEGLVWGNINTDYHVNSNIKLKDSQIIVTTELKLFGHINFEGGVTEGNLAWFILTDVYDLGVTADGLLKVTHDNDASNLNDKSETLDKNVWAEIASFGTVDDLLEEFPNSSKNWMQNLIGSYETMLQSILDNSPIWVYPGSKTFTFANPAFSQNQDLVAQITYVEPS